LQEGAREELGLDGILAELNPRQPDPAMRMLMRALELLCKRGHAAVQVSGV